MPEKERMNDNMNRKYAVEHIGISVEDPLAMAQWYRDALGFKIGFSSRDADKAVAFITDSEGKITIEIGKLPGIEPLAGKLGHHLQFHIALRSEDPESDMAFLVGKGAAFIERSPITRPGDLLLTLRDPWGNCIQLSKRGSTLE
jgi:catechol 2,3-dioxygenase-like lactoylglutathione lyase family enzyme